MLFWLGWALLVVGYAISIALAHVALGVCYTTKRERGGGHYTGLGVTHTPGMGQLILIPGAN